VLLLWGFLDALEGGSVVVGVGRERGAIWGLGGAGEGGEGEEWLGIWGVGV